MATSATTTTSYGGNGKRISAPHALFADPELGPWLVSDLDVNIHNVDESAPWLLRITWRLEGGKADPVRVDLRGRQGQPVTPEVWRSIPLGSVLEESRILLAGLSHIEADYLDAHGFESAAEKVRKNGEALTPRRGRKATYSTDHFGRVARVYMEAVQLGSRTPVKAVIAAFLPEFNGLDLPSDQRAKGWINRAKKMGLIPGERNNENG